MIWNVKFQLKYHQNSINYVKLRKLYITVKFVKAF